MLARELRREGVRTKRGKLVDKGYLYKLLNNQTYLGLAVHKGTAYPGEHAAIIDQDLWDKVHAILAENARTRSARTRAQTPALLKGLIFGPTGAAMSPTHTRKGNRLYRYYVSQDVLKRGPEACPVGRVPAAEIEAAVIDQLRGVFRQPEIIVGTWRAARAEQDDITEDEAREALAAARPALGRAVPGRAGADRAAAGRAGRRRHRRREPPPARRRARRAGARGGGLGPEGRGMTRRTVHRRGPAGVRGRPPVPHRPRRSAVAVPEPHRQGRARASPALPLRDAWRSTRSAALPVAEIVAEPAHLYLWVPNALLAEGLAVMAAWGFTYKTTLVWHKVRKDGGSDGRGVGFYFRNVTESVLFGVRGRNARTLAPGRRQTNLIATRKREHSRKPDELYPIIEACSRGPFLELFARGSRPGWTSWGQEVDRPELPIAAE